MELSVCKKITTSRNSNSIEKLHLMAHLHYERQTQDTDSDMDSDSMATLYYAEHAHIAQTQTLIPTLYGCI